VRDPRASIPSVDSLVTSEAFEDLLSRYPRSRVVEATRKAVDDLRVRFAEGDELSDISAPSTYATIAELILSSAEVPSLRRVVNATGVVLHTNLGRAPLAASAQQAMATAAVEYTNLEYDLDEGARGSRYSHCVSLLTELTGAESALVVNNAAGGLVLIMNTLARGSGVAVSRGELVEIGGGFRIPEIIERSSAKLFEVGSTNRTRLPDYAEVLKTGGVGTVLKVHRSNFKISGFTEEATLPDLVKIAAEHKAFVVHDLGSGLMIPADQVGLPEEPSPQDSLEAGCDLVVFSGDKLLGGPQAGIVLGRENLIAQLRANPLCRALRVDKVTLAGLEATLRLYRDPDQALREIPTLRMLSSDFEELADRAQTLADQLTASEVDCEVIEVGGSVGGGTYPGIKLRSSALQIAAPSVADLGMLLRSGDPPVIARILDDRLVLDVRTVLPNQEEDLISRVSEVLSNMGDL